MRAALFGSVTAESEAMGSLVETAVFSQWLHSGKFIADIYYARWKNREVDLVALDKVKQKPEWLTEVKWSDRVVSHDEDIKGVIEFAQSFPQIKKPILVTTRTISQPKLIQDVLIEFRPCAELVYSLGKNILGIEN